MSDNAVSIALFVALAVGLAVIANRVTRQRGWAAVGSAAATIVIFHIAIFLVQGRFGTFFPIGLVFGGFYALLVTAPVTFAYDRIERSRGTAGRR